MFISHCKNFLKNKHTYIHILFSSLVTCFLFFLSYIVIDSYTMNGKEFALSDYRSMKFNELNQREESKDLSFIVVDSIYTDEVPKGTIFSQSPESGTFVKKGRKIYLTMNCNSRQLFVVPDIYNKSEREAFNQLSRHFIVDKIESHNTENSVVVKLKVGDSEIFPGQKLIEGSKVTMIFGGGRGNQLINNPNLIGLSYYNARSILTDSELSIGEVKFKGQIIDTLNTIIYNQFPLPNSMLQAGDEVNIILQQNMDTILN